MENYKVYNEEKTMELDRFDLNKGYLNDDKIFVAHHPATVEVQKQSHMEVIAEYPNGGKDIVEVIDVPYSPAQEAWDEYEDIKVYIPYTAEQQKKADNKRYELKVEIKIREKYSISQELAILRQRDSKPEEYAEYNAYCEECKAGAKKEVYGV